VPSTNQTHFIPQLSNIQLVFTVERVSKVLFELVEGNEMEQIGEKQNIIE